MNNVKILFLLCTLLYHKKQLYSYGDYDDRIKNRLLIRQAFFLNDKEKQTSSKKNKKRLNPLGDPWLSYVENIYEYKNIKIGYSLLKKSGERISKIIPGKTIFLYNSNNEFFLVENVSIIKNFIIGDFSLGFGQGLVFNNSFIFRPLEQIKVIKIQRGIERINNHVANKIKGLAGTFKISNNISTTLFAGKNYIDGRVFNNTITSACRRLTYDSNKNIEKKNKIKETIKGFNFLFYNKDDSLEIGFNFVKTTFNLPFQPVKKISHLFQGNSNINYSYFARYLLGPIHFFLENAYSRAEETSFTKKFGHGKALLCGFIANTVKEIDIALCYRKYAPNYYNFYGRSFCVCNNTNSSQLKGAGKNERGLYFCTLIKIYNNIDLTYSYDIYKNQWQSYKYKCKNGHEHLLSLKYYQKRNVFSLFLKEKMQSITTQKGETIKNNTYYIKGNMKLTWDNNIVLLVQKHISFEKISKISAGVYLCLTIPFKKNKIDIFLIAAKISGNKNLYINKKKGYREQGSTTINNNVFILGFSLNIKISRKLLINIFFEYCYKKKYNNMPNIKISLVSLS